jgi:hypothetical protein
MASSRNNYAATLLNNGKALLVGGLGSTNAGPTPLDAAEVYTP